MDTKNYKKKSFLFSLFNEKTYANIKSAKIILDFKLGRNWEISPLLKNLVNPDDIVFDIGANVGQFACRFNKLIHSDKGKVYCFEPLQVNFNALGNMKKIFNLRNVIINKLALSNVIETMSINTPILDSGLTMHAWSTLLEISSYNYKTELVNVTTIDNFVIVNNIKKIDFIKIDTEGNEINVLNGGKVSISKYKPLIYVEIRYNISTISWLYDLGYLPFIYDYKTNKLRPIKNDEFENSFMNLILVHKDKEVGIKNSISYVQLSAE